MKLVFTGGVAKIQLWIVHAMSFWISVISEWIGEVQGISAALVVLQGAKVKLIQENIRVCNTTFGLNNWIFSCFLEFFPAMWWLKYWLVAGNGLGNLDLKFIESHILSSISVSGPGSRPVCLSVLLQWSGHGNDHWQIQGNVAVVTFLHHQTVTNYMLMCWKHQNQIKTTTSAIY